LKIEIIKSVGIDIGTSTTKMMLSELTLGRVSSRFSLPQFDIVDRKVIYMSEIISTPLKNNDEIDLLPLIKWLEIEYQKAGVTLEMLKSGAAIITGETAIKKNADALLHYLAERSGDFVVAIAGASLEAVLAGRGSGAYEHSLKYKEVIANVDIGGGTANVVFLKQGKVLDTITFHVGGRLIELDTDGEVLFVSPSLIPWLQYRHIKIGNSLSYTQLSEIAAKLCVDMLDVLSGRKSVPPLVHSSSGNTLPRLNRILISGGVGRLALEQPPITIAEITRYKDFGPLLASELLKVLAKYPFEVVKPSQTSSATVIGAGMQTTKLSGATISIKTSLLPMRNVPVMKVPLIEGEFHTQLKTAFRKGKNLFGGPFAIGLGGMTYLSYAKLKELADELGKQFTYFFPQSELLVIVCENDMAKALGQLLMLQNKIEVICIDQVVIEHGDYIDIGEPLNDNMVPVVVKTLAFR
jgi:ethanolamine utilization protein EutA